jgi:hypothetical protein
MPQPPGLNAPRPNMHTDPGQDQWQHSFHLAQWDISSRRGSPTIGRVSGICRLELNSSKSIDLRITPTVRIYMPLLPPRPPSVA